MLRIAHISDLHIKHPKINNEDLSVLQMLAKMLAKTKDFEVEAEGHSEEKLLALVNALKSLKPDLIVVTGDITARPIPTCGSGR